ncbi:MAG: 6,7-dimethyl-8-ribityllumazine synthase [bacterium]
MAKSDEADFIHPRPRSALNTMKRFIGSLTGKGMKFSIVASRFNSLITDRLLDAAADALLQHGVAADDISVYRVPGSFEIPYAIKTLIDSGKAGDGVVALGAVLRGETSHYDVIINEVAHGVRHLTLTGGVPIGFGVITADNLDQGLDRAGGKMGNKGTEAALAALELANLTRQIAAGRKSNTR